MNRRFLIIIGFSLLARCGTITAAVLNDTISVNDTITVQKLDEVVVKTQYRYARRKGDRFVISFKGSPFYEGKTLEEGLSMCPLINRRGDSYNILGKESTVIYINGRPSTLSEDNLIAFLSAKNVAEVERVEIIALPSGRFADAKKTGVINIVMLHDSQIGTLSMINAGVVKGHNFGGLANGMFALNVKDVSINVFANYANQKKKRLSESLYEFVEQEHVREISDFSQHGRPLAIKGSVEWRKANNLFGCSYTYSMLFMDADYLNSSDNASTWVKNSNSRHHYNTIQVYDDFKIKAHEISFLYSLYDRRNKTDDIYSASDISQHYDYSKYVINNAKVNVTSYLSDSWKLEYGISANNLRMTSDFAYDNYNNSNIQYKENILNGYISTSKEMGHWSMGVGLQYDYVWQNLNGNKKEYGKWLPNANVTYQEDWGQLYSQFSKVVERVPYVSLTLSPVFFSPNSMTIGNPKLNPENNYNMTLGFSKGNLNVEAFYKMYENSCMEYSYADNGKTVNSFINLDDEYQFGMNIYYSHSLSEILLGRISLSSYFDHSNVQDIGKTNSWNNYLSTSLTIRPDKKKRFDVDISYWNLFPQKEHGVEWKNRGCLSMNFNYNIIPSKLRLTLKINDLFNQDLARNSRMYRNVSVIRKNTFDNRKVALTINYTFSNKKKVGKNQNKSIDDVNRIPAE